MFVPHEQLAFNLTRLLNECVTDWALGQPLPEGCDDLIVAEMDSRGLRFFSADSDEALFDGERNVADYRLCIVDALNRLQSETSKPRTREDVENYNRPCGE